MTPARPKLREFFAVWNQFARTAAQREDRLSWCAQQLGQAVDSMNDLNDDDLTMLIAELRRLMKQGSSRVVNMRGKPDQRGAGATKEQIWKVRQLEAYLGWRAEPERLAGFLRSKFKVDRAEQLSARDAWRAIEALAGVAAQSEFNGRKPTKEEKRAAVVRIKGVLKTWRPAA